MKGSRTQSMASRSLPRPSLVRSAIVAFLFTLQSATFITPAIAQSRPKDENLPPCTTKTYSYSCLLKDLDRGKVEKLDIDRVQQVARVKLPNESKPIEVPLFNQNQELIEKARANRTPVNIQDSSDNSALMGILVQLFLFMLLLGGLLMIIRRSANAPGGPGQALNFGKSRARFQMEAKTGVMFDDVAGIENAGGVEDVLDPLEGGGDDGPIERFEQRTADTTVAVLA